MLSANHIRTLVLALGLIAGAMVLVACGNDADAPGSQASGARQLSGSILVDGSSTVFPITEAVAEEFLEAQRNVRVTVGVSGTGGGFQKFCNGETAIQNASRPITAREIEAALPRASSTSRSLWLTTR